MTFKWDSQSQPHGEGVEVRLEGGEGMRHGKIRGKNMLSHQEKPIQQPRGRTYLVYLRNSKDTHVWRGMNVGRTGHAIRL